MAREIHPLLNVPRRHLNSLITMESHSTVAGTLHALNLLLNPDGGELIHEEQRAWRTDRPRPDHMMPALPPLDLEREIRAATEQAVASLNRLDWHAGTLAKTVIVSAAIRQVIESTGTKF